MASIGQDQSNFMLNGWLALLLATDVFSLWAILRVPSNGTIYSSTNGSEWTEVAKIPGAVKLSFAGQFFWLETAATAGNPRRFYTSTTGLQWQEVVALHGFSGITFGSGSYWGFKDGSLFSSKDGSTWSLASSQPVINPATGMPFRIPFHFNNRILATEAGGFARSSPILPFIAAHREGDQLLFEIVAEGETKYTIEATSDFQQWSELGETSTITLEDDLRFFRAKALQE
jgi:hypothetical protein